jgi:hypothetical protein
VGDAEQAQLASAADHLTPIPAARYWRFQASGWVGLQVAVKAWKRVAVMLER